MLKINKLSDIISTVVYDVNRYSIFDLIDFVQKEGYDIE